jgi:hypothetical protein
VGNSKSQHWTTPGFSRVVDGQQRATFPSFYTGKSGKMPMISSYLSTIGVQQERRIMIPLL